MEYLLIIDGTGFECGNEYGLSLLSELSKRLQFHYVVGNHRLYPKALQKFNRGHGHGIGCFANHIHDTSQILAVDM